MGKGPLIGGELGIFPSPTSCTVGRAGNFQYERICGKYEGTCRKYEEICDRRIPLYIACEFAPPSPVPVCRLSKFKKYEKSIIYFII